MDSGMNPVGTLDLDHDACYRAIAVRDSRFDGRLFTGVKTTGIYCRPICPAPTPLAKNVRFFACAAAAVGKKTTFSGRGVRAGQIGRQ